MSNKSNIQSILSPESSLNEGVVRRPRPNYKKSNFKREKVIKCPKCGKEQSYLKEICIECEYNFKKHREDEIKDYLAELKNKNLHIPAFKQSRFINNTYFNDPYVFSNKEDLLQYVTKKIEFNPNGSKILFVTKDSLIKNEIRDKLKKENSIIDGGYLFDLIKNIDDFQIVNESLSRKYSVKIYDNIKSTDSIPDLKIIEKNVRYIEKKDVTLLNNFIKIYWDYWELCHSISTDKIKFNRNIQNQLEKYKKRIKSFGVLCYSYFNEIPFDLTIDDLIEKFNLNLKFNELVENEIIEGSKLKNIYKNVDDFINDVQNLDNIKEKIKRDFDICSIDYRDDLFQDTLNYSSNFKSIRNFCENIIEFTDICILDLSQINRIFNRSYLSFFDQIICYDEEFSDKDKFYLYLLSKGQLIFVKLEEVE